jgi:hypothetical protein
MTTTVQYVQVSWELPTRAVGGAAVLPAQIAGMRVRFWREDMVGTPVSSTDVPVHMLSITVGLGLGRWLFTVQAILHGGVEGEQSLPKMIVVGTGAVAGAPRAPRNVRLALLPGSSAAV